jgi:hypothetical protein
MLILRRNKMKIRIYEPGMCCPTGLCGPSINPEIMRITTVMNTLEKDNVDIKRFNLTSNPDEFVNNNIINNLLVNEGEEVFPVTLLNDEIVKKRNYPNNEELSNWTGIKLEKNKSKTESSGCCSDSNVCSIDCSPKNPKPNSGCGGGGCC